MNNDVTLRHITGPAAQEIKASAHYAYISTGITLDGSKFLVKELLMEGQFLVKNNTTGKYEKYSESTPGTFPAGYSDPVILDESIMFAIGDNGVNCDQTAGQVLVHGSVYTSMLTGVTDTFKNSCKGIYFVD